MVQECCFSIILKRGSYCTSRDSAQRVVVALESRATAVDIDAFFFDDVTHVYPVTIQLSEFVRFIEHGPDLTNPAFEAWNGTFGKVVSLASRRA